MKKFKLALLAGSLLAASVAANAQVLNFNTSVIFSEPANSGAVPLLSRNPAPNLGGFIDETVSYNGFLFSFTGVPSSPDAWVWMTEPAAPNLGFQQYGYAYNSGVAGNGYLLHGCSFAACGVQPELTNTITNTTPFSIQSLKISRFVNGQTGPDPLTMILSGGTGPQRVVDLVALTPGAQDFVPTTVINPFANEYFTTIRFAGYKGFFGVDDIVYAPIPEPGTYAMMLLGLGAVGFVARRRSNK